MGASDLFGDWESAVCEDVQPQAERVHGETPSCRQEEKDGGDICIG